MTRRIRIGIIDSGVHAAHPHIGNITGGVTIANGAPDPSCYVDHLGHGTAIAALKSHRRRSASQPTRSAQVHRCPRIRRQFCRRATPFFYVSPHQPTFRQQLLNRSADANQRSSSAARRQQKQPPLLHRLHPTRILLCLLPKLYLTHQRHARAEMHLLRRISRRPSSNDRRVRTSHTPIDGPLVHIRHPRPQSLQ